MAIQPSLPPSLARLHKTLSNSRLGSIDSSNEIGAVVSVILIERDQDDLEVLLVHRAEREGDPWSGHIGLPGGKVKRTDASLIDACMREAVEEVGINLETSDLIGSLSPSYPSNRPELKVQPFVFGLASRPRITLGVEIVDSFWVHLSQLPSSKGPREVTTRIGKRLVDTFLADGRIVWGFTYRVLEELLKLNMKTS